MTATPDKALRLLFLSELYRLLDHIHRRHHLKGIIIIVMSILNTIITITFTTTDTTSPVSWRTMKYCHR